MGSNRASTRAETGTRLPFSSDPGRLFRSCGRPTAPECVTLYELPPTIVDIMPKYRSYRYTVVRDEILIIDPCRSRLSRLERATDWTASYFRSHRGRARELIAKRSEDPGVTSSIGNVKGLKVLDPKSPNREEPEILAATFGASAPGTHSGIGASYTLQSHGIRPRRKLWQVPHIAKN